MSDLEQGVGVELAELIAYLEDLAPPALQASYDNSGLLVGDPNTPISGVLVTLDCLEATVEEAHAAGCNVVVAHHPIIFGGLKRLTSASYVERTVRRAVQLDVAIYAVHTNLDSVLAEGVNGRLAALLGLRDVRVLEPTRSALQKLVVYVPKAQTELVAEALYAAGAGQLGRYERASFRVDGTGSFRASAGARPAIGEVGRDEFVDETKLEVVVPRVRARAALNAARRVHPYEAMAYDLFDIAGEHDDFGMGAIGTLPTPMRSDAWLAYLSERLGLAYVKYTALAEPARSLERVALCGGSGASLLRAAKQQGAEAYVTADFKYHEFFDAEGRLMICDIGHYESERHTIQLLQNAISRRFATFAARSTSLVTNPVSLYLPRPTG